MTPAAPTRRISDPVQHTAASTTNAPDGAASRGAALGALALLLLAAGVRLLGLDHTPHYDELYHVLAARSLLEDGTLQLGDGFPYVRARLFTFLVAGSFALFGESLATARVPAVAAGALLAAFVYAWVRRRHGPLAGWIAGLLVCFAPSSIYLSQQARFYTLHALLMWIGMTALFDAVVDAPRAGRRTGAWLAVVASFAVAYTLQVTTVIGVGAAAAAALVASAPRWWKLPARARFLGLGLAVAAGAALLYARGPELWERFRWSAPWGAHARGEHRYYYGLFLRQYPAIWPALPVLALAAAIRSRRAAAYLTVAFFLILGVLSFAAWKHERYIFFALPLAFALAAMGVAAVFEWLWSAFAGEWKRLRAWARAGVVALAVGAAGFLLIGQDAVSYSYRMLTVSDADWWLPWYYRGEPDWERAAELLGDRDPRGVVLASSKLKALYYLGDLDFVLGREPLMSGDALAPDFTREDQLGRPVVYSPDAVRRIVACEPSGLVVVERGAWDNPLRVDAALSAFLEAELRRVDLPGELRLLAFSWDRGSGAAAVAPRLDGAACAPVPGPA